MTKTRFSITMAGGPGNGKESRLATILTGLTLEVPQVLGLDCRDQETLSLALPELLRQAGAKADEILATENLEIKAKA